MKFFLILPETCASTWCLFSSSTLNMALGSGSTTVAITSIASSLLIDSLGKRLKAALLRQNHRAIFCDCDAMFEVGAVAAIGSHRGPFIFQYTGRRTSRI